MGAVWIQILTVADMGMDMDAGMGAGLGAGIGMGIGIGTGVSMGVGMGMGRVRGKRGYVYNDRGVGTRCTNTGVSRHGCTCSK